MVSPAQRDLIRYREVDATNYASLERAMDGIDGGVCIATEGLLMYFTESEAGALCDNVRRILEKKGGCWYVADPEASLQYVITMCALVGDRFAQIMQNAKQQVKDKSDVAIVNPEGNTEGAWAWADGAQAVGSAGENAFKASFTPADAGNYNVVTDMDVAVAVAKAEVAVPEIAAKPYTGQPQAADVPASELYSVGSNEPVTQAGSYDVVISLVDPANYKWADSDEADKTLEFRIVADGKNYVSVGLEGWTYGEAPKAPVATATFGQDTLAYSYAASEDGPFTADVPTDAGVWYVRASVAATSDYKAGEATARFEIAKAASWVSAAPKPANPAYTGKAQALAAPGSAEGGTMEYSLDAEAWSRVVPAVAEPGAYIVYYRVAGDANHDDSAVKGVVSIISKADLSKAKVTLAPTSYAYTGKALKPAVKSVVLDGRTLAAGTDYAVSYKNNVNAGTATVTVTGKGDYAGEAAATFTIKKAANKLTVKTAKKTVKASKKAQAVKVLTKAKPKFKAKVTYAKAKTAKTKNTKAASKTVTVTVKVKGKAAKLLSAV